jgi:glyoxylate reductase
MPEKVLILHRFPKSQMVRIGQRFELLDAAGKKPGETFSPEQLGSVRAVLAAGGSRLGADT